VSGGSRTGRVAERLRRAIADGRLVPGERLPPETELAEELAVSRGTLREAMRGLVEEGYLRRRPGAGTFVTQRPVMRNNLERNFGVTRLIETFGLEAGTLERELAVEPADAETADALGLAEGDPVNVLRRVRTAEGEPVVYSIDHWSTDLVGDTVVDDQTSIYQVLRDHGLEVHHGVAKLRPSSADAELARRLRTARGALVMEIWQVDFTDREQPLLASREYHLADAFEISVYRRGPGFWEI
jgi:DNA-binding GntR family transcriptional regulator